MPRPGSTRSISRRDFALAVCPDDTRWQPNTNADSPGGCASTSSGTKLRSTWEVDPDATEDPVAARALLLKMTAAWSPAERDGIGRFLQTRIQAERATDPSAPWQEYLRRALDYRLWHRFGMLRFQDGQWKKLTKQTYGTGSGGEKALTLTLSQFAAAAAH